MASTAGPRLVVEQPELDLGLREPGAKIEFSFRLKNSGTAPLQIEGVKPGCGCIVARCDREIAPGGQGEVTASLDSTSFQGPFEKRILLFTNDPEARAFPLQVKVNLQPLIAVVPGQGLHFLLEPGKGAEQVVTLRSSWLKQFTIVQVESDTPSVQAEVVPARSEPPAGADSTPLERAIRVRVLPNAPSDPFTAAVTIHTDGERRARIVLSVNVEPDAPVRVVPPRIYFDGIPANPEKPIAREIVLLIKDDSLKLQGAESDDPALRLEVVTGRVGRVPGVRVWYAGGWKPGHVKGTIVLKTSDPARPRLEVPYTAEVRP